MPGVLPLEPPTAEAEGPQGDEIHVRHEIEIAGIALAALVRLTRHAGIGACWTMILICNTST